MPLRSIRSNDVDQFAGAFRTQVVVVSLLRVAGDNDIVQQPPASSRIAISSAGLKRPVGARGYARSAQAFEAVLKLLLIKD